VGLVWFDLVGSARRGSALVWSDMVWSGLVRSDMVWSGLVWSGLVRSGLVLSLGSAQLSELTLVLKLRIRFIFLGKNLENCLVLHKSFNLVLLMFHQNLLLLIM